MLINGSPNDLLTRISRGLHKLLRAEHLVDLLSVGHLAAMIETLAGDICDDLRLRVMTVRGLHRRHLLLCLQVDGSRRVRHGMWGLVHRSLHLVLALCLVVVKRWPPPLLVVAIGMRTIATRHLVLSKATGPIAHALILHATHGIGALALLVALAVALVHGASTTLLTTNLQLVHQQAKRGDQLDQIGIFGAHDVHLVLLVGFLVDLLLKVEPASLPWLDKGNIKVATFEEDLCRSLLCSSSRLTIGEADESHGSLVEQLDIVHVAKLQEELTKLFFARGRIDVLYNEVHVHHRLLPLIGRACNFKLALLFRLGLADVDTPRDIVTKLLEVIESFLGGLALLEADEAEST